jgi:hypothetical protein
MARMRLSTFQTVFKIGFPVFVLLTVPLTLWVATTFRDPNIKAYSSRNADFNADGTVDATDLQLFESSYLALEPKADINADGRVDSSDFALFSKFYRGEK